MTEISKDTQKLVETLRKVPVIMLTSMGRDGHLNSRPMVLQEIDPDGTMWFFIGRTAAVTDELNHNAQVSVSHAEGTTMTYIAVAGKACLVDDRARISVLWRAEYLTWFSLGVNDPDLALMRVDIETAERWQDGNHLHLAKSH